MTAPLARLLLSDATLPFNFCKAGIPAARALAAYLGDRAYVVDEVFNELTRLAEEGNATLTTFLESWPPNPPLRLDPELRLQVGSVVAVRALSTAHSGEDRGETATVLYAERRRATSGELFEILTDDTWGRQIADDRGLRCHNTPALIVAMVCADALTFKDGQRVWNASFTNREKWKGYRDAVARSCPAKLPPPQPKKPKATKKRKRS